MTIKISPEIRALLRPLTEHERQRLRDSLIEDGCLVPLLVEAATGTLLDGHNRHRECAELGIKYDVRQITLPPDVDPVSWVIDHQLARRNLTPREYRYWVGKRYEAEKAHATDTLKQNAPRSQNDSAGRTREKIAATTGLSAKTVQRAYELSAAVDLISDRVGDEFKSGILSGELELTDGDVKLLASCDDIESMESVRTFIDDRKAARRPRPSSTTERPFRTKTVTGWTTYIATDTGEECIDSWELSCGHTAPSKRGTPVRETHQKTRPCYECGSGTRTPYERRRSAEAFDAAFTASFDPDMRDDWKRLARASLLLATLGPMDSRAQRVRAEVTETLQALGLLVIDSAQEVA